VPSNTNNQILKDVALGLWTQNSNVNAYTFGEDWFNGDEDPVGGGAVYDEPWAVRESEFDEPTVATGGLPIKFWFSVDPWAIGLQNAPTSPTAVEDEATIFGAFMPPAGQPGFVDEDLNPPAGAPPYGVGPWRSNGEAAGDVFSADPILAPGVNIQEYDEAILALWGPRSAGSEDPNMEDDLDALECVGNNSAGEPGNTHDRVMPTMGSNGGVHPPDLGSPTNANHDAQINYPIIFSVDRGSFGAFGSAVHAQLVDPNEGAAGDLFIATTFQVPGSGTWVTTNMLLIDEGQLGLMPHDDLDAVIVHLLLTEGELEERIIGAIPDYNTVGLEPISRGYGWTIPLLNNQQVQEAAVGFSVDTSSIGLVNTAVDFECRMDGTGNAAMIPPGSGIMEQPGDIFFANLLPPPGQVAKDRGTGLLLCQNYLWFEERDLGLDRGNWTFITPPGPSGDLADLPDELNALDSLWDDEGEPCEPNWPGYVKWLQPPDESNLGIDIRCDREDGIDRTLADDFECDTPGPITDVHIWGSWKYDIKGKIEKFHLSIHENIPIGAYPYSMPGRLLWERDINDFNEILHLDLSRVDDWEWWWDPYTSPDALPQGDQKIWRYDIFIDPCEAFLQMGTPEDPCIYWLDVWVDLEPNDNMPEFGWKTSYMHWEDDAVMEIDTPPWWKELRYPPGHPLHEYPPDMNSIDMAFAITTLDCFPQTDPNYGQWVSVGRPYCWCYPRQCHSDADNNAETKGNFWVYVNDLGVLLAAWGKPYPLIAGQKSNGVPLICADSDHLQETKGNFRVYVADLGILLANWGTSAVPPDCP
jgi:hypothetical protein